MTTAPKATGPLSDESPSVRFFKALFEFSFKEFVTPKLISILYGVALIGIGLSVLRVVFGALDNDFLEGPEKLAAILIVIGVGFLGVLYVRVLLELIVVVFKIAEPVTDGARTLHRIEQMLAGEAPMPVFDPGGDSSTNSRLDASPDPGSNGHICSSCGTQAGAGEKFCRSCGHVLESDVD